MRMTFDKAFVLSSPMVAPFLGPGSSRKLKPNQIRSHQPRIKCAKDLLRYRRLLSFERSQLWHLNEHLECGRMRNARNADQYGEFL